MRGLAELPQQIGQPGVDDHRRRQAEEQRKQSRPAAVRWRLRVLDRRCRVEIALQHSGTLREAGVVVAAEAVGGMHPVVQQTLRHQDRVELVQAAHHEVPILGERQRRVKAAGVGREVAREDEVAGTDGDVGQQQREAGAGQDAEPGEDGFVPAGEGIAIGDRAAFDEIDLGEGEEPAGVADLRHGAAQAAGDVGVIGVQDGQRVAVSHFHQAVERGGHAGVVLAIQPAAHPPLAADGALRHLQRVVGGAVVEHQQLDVRPVLHEHGGDGGIDIGGVVVGWNENADPWPAVQDGGGGERIGRCHGGLVSIRPRSSSWVTS